MMVVDTTTAGITTAGTMAAGTTKNLVIGVYQIRVTACITDYSFTSQASACSRVANCGSFRFEKA
jgi:hypothetical protein